MNLTFHKQGSRRSEVGKKTPYFTDLRLPTSDFGLQKTVEPTFQLS